MSKIVTFTTIFFLSQLLHIFTSYSIVPTSKLTNNEFLLQNINNFHLSKENKTDFQLAIEDDVNKIFYNLVQDFINYSNQTLMQKYVYDNEQCRDSLAPIFTQTSTELLFQVLSYSGKSLHDIGDEESCKSLGLTYLFTVWRVCPYVYDEKYNYLYTFNGVNRFFQGFCLPSNCDEFYKNYFNVTTQPDLLERLKPSGIWNFELYNGDNNKKISVGFIIFLAYNLISIIVVCIVSIIGEFYLRRDIRTNSLNEDDSFFEDDDEYSASKRFSLYSGFIKKKCHRPVLEEKKIVISKTENLIMTLHSHISLSESLKHLTQVKSKIFDDSNIESLCVVRFVISAWMAFHHIHKGKLSKL